MFSTWGNQASPLAIRMGSHVQLTLSHRLFRAWHSELHFSNVAAIWCIAFLVRGRGPCKTKCNIFLQTMYLAFTKWELFRVVCNIGYQGKEVFESLRCFLGLVIIACWVWRSQKETRSTKSLLSSHSTHSFLPVAALVLGSLGCSGLGVKLLHQTRVSSTGRLTEWLLSSCPAILQKTHSGPLWRAVMKSMAWYPSAFDSASKESYMIE